MFKIFYAESDATLYEHKANVNTGIDEILEVGKRIDVDGENIKKSRSLVKFNTTQITDALTKYSTN